MKQGKGTALLVKSARSKLAFWTEQREAAARAHDRDAEATARRFADEYEQFISLLTGEVGTT